MKIKDNQLQAILAEVEAEIGSLLKNEQEKLSKAVNPDEDPSKEKSAPAPDASASAPVGEGSAPAEGSAPPAEGSAPPMGDPGMDDGSGMPPGAEGSAPPSADPAAAGPMDPQALQAEYEALPPEELQMHLMAAQAAAQKLLAGAGAGGPDAGGAPGAVPPAGPPGMEASAPPAPGGPEMPPPPTMKMELGAIAPKGKETGAGPDRLAAVGVTKQELNINNKGNGGVMKSEAQDSELEALKAQVSVMAKALELMTETPVRKAITSLDAIQKSEPAKSNKSLSKAEVTEKLKQISSNPNLSKSARQTINDYYDGKVSFENLNLDGLK